VRPLNLQTDSFHEKGGGVKTVFECVAADEVGIFINYTAAIVNGTDSVLSVRDGGTSAGGRVTSPLWIVLGDKKLSNSSRES
jgi:hypothetical protein